MLGKKRKSYQSSGGMRRYQGGAKTYKNPFFESSKRNSGKTAKKGGKFSIPLKIKIITSVVMGLLMFAFWFCLYSSYFMIDFVEARGGGRLDPVEIQDIAWKQIWDSSFILWQQKNIFIFDEEELINTLNLNYSFNDIIVSKKLPNKIIINFNEKDHSLIWKEKDIYYFADTHGYIVDRIGDTINDLKYPVFQNDSEFFIDSNRISIKNEMINFALATQDAIRSEGDMEIEKFIIDNNDYTLKVQLGNGPQLYFDINKDINKQLSKVITLKNDILKEDFYHKEYIDVRIGDRVYHK